MTKLQSATSSTLEPDDGDSSASTPNSGCNLVEEEEESQTEIILDLKHDMGSRARPQNMISEIDGFQKQSNINDSEESEDVESEPLGYQNFLSNVNIEYNLGGNRSSSGSYEHCFKMKHLPYMVEHKNRQASEIISEGSSDTASSYDQDKLTIADCQNGHSNGYNKDDAGDLSEIHIDLTSITQKHIDVTKATCAFLGNSDYAPNLKNRRRRVVIELVSAKLSQNSSQLASANSSNMTNLINLAEVSTNHGFDTSVSSENSVIDCIQASPNRPSEGNQLSAKSIDEQQQQLVASLSSKKFVNYTILIRTVPGLDYHPAVIERRFSDFLILYQGLKSIKRYAKLVDQYVAFPKKVYIGNFNLVKIAERSVEFTRLLHLCLHHNNLMWSVPFASFLIDRELREAHRLSLFGDPDDVQALVETVYYILKKLYLPKNSSKHSSSILSPFKSSSHNSSLDCSTSCCSLTGTTTTLPNSVTEQTRSSQLLTTGYVEEVVANADHADQKRVIESPNATSSLINYEIAQPPGSNTYTAFASIGPINQRLLVTYCMLFIVHCRNDTFLELKQAVLEFIQLISAQDFVDSLISTRHYNSLRACLLFLMNLSQRDVVDEPMRLWLKRKLEDVDVSHAELYGNHATAASTNGRIRVTKKDLTSLLRDRNFCTFQDNIK